MESYFQDVFALLDSLALPSLASSEHPPLSPLAPPPLPPHLRGPYLGDLGIHVMKCHQVYTHTHSLKCKHLPERGSRPQQKNRLRKDGRWSTEPSSKKDSLSSRA